MEKRLVRSKNDKMLGGVLAGIAEYLGWDITVIRVTYAIITFLSASFPGTLIYIILWIVMPEE
ncbi:MAG TPA: PspC domain-containing protein [Candidatus Marinimicrobia bacterium]|nr:PspC domain-containing protein [Candidatus Neomarinimicrobiota bacterium]